MWEGLLIALLALGVLQLICPKWYKNYQRKVRSQAIQKAGEDSYKLESRIRFESLLPFGLSVFLAWALFK